MIILGELIKIRGSDNYSDTGGISQKVSIPRGSVTPKEHARKGEWLTK